MLRVKDWWLEILLLFSSPRYGRLAHEVRC
jgi:hypothetical protein